MKIETVRLYLRKYKASDLSNFYNLKSCPSVWIYSTFQCLTSIEKAKTLLTELIRDQNNSEYSFHALFIKETDEFIGEAGIISYNAGADRCTIGYNLLPQFWNNGYATEISKGLVVMLSPN